MPRRRLDARARNVDGVLHVAGPEHAFALSSVGASIWRLVDGARTLREVGAAIATEYDVDLDTAARDAAGLLAELEAHGIVELIGPDG